MAKPTTVLIKLVSSAGTGTFYPRREQPEDDGQDGPAPAIPKSARHVEFREADQVDVDPRGLGRAAGMSSIRAFQPFGLTDHPRTGRENCPRYHLPVSAATGRIDMLPFTSGWQGAVAAGSCLRVPRGATRAGGRRGSAAASGRRRWCSTGRVGYAVRRARTVRHRAPPTPPARSSGSMSAGPCCSGAGARARAAAIRRRSRRFASW